MHAILLKIGDVTIDIYPYKYCKIQVARGNFSYYEIHPLLHCKLFCREFSYKQVAL